MLGHLSAKNELIPNISNERRSVPDLPAIPLNEWFRRVRSSSLRDFVHFACYQLTMNEMATNMCLKSAYRFLSPDLPG
jgi:hypothetical protein